MYGITILIILLVKQDIVRSVRLVELRVPTHEREGGSALLGCQYDLEGDTLYAVKWYKDGKEFFKYAPRIQTPMKHFKLPGVHVNESRSSTTVVALENLTRESAGLYACEVSGEAPSFMTARSEKYITVHLIPDTRPKLTGLKDKYFLDDLVVSNCTTAPSTPEAHLKWLINDKPVLKRFLRGPWYRVSADRPDAIETTLQLRFTVTPSDFVDGAMKLTCQSTIAPLYQQETTSTHYIDLPLSLETPSPVSSPSTDHAIKTNWSILTVLLSVLFLRI